jgi:hypothetical protein
MQLGRWPGPRRPGDLRVHPQRHRSGAAIGPATHARPPDGDELRHSAARLPFSLMAKRSR